MERWIEEEQRASERRQEDKGQQAGVKDRRREGGKGGREGERGG